MAELDLALAECLDQMQRSGASIEDCLRNHPQHRNALTPLLRAWQSWQTHAGAPASAGPSHRTRALLLQGLRARPRHRRSTLAGGPVRLAWASLLAIAMALPAGMLAAQASMPEDALYSWKLASERIARSLTRDRAEVDRLRLERRTMELIRTSSFPERQSLARRGLLEVLADL